MNFEEHAGKAVLRRAGIATPDSGLARTPEEASGLAGKIGPCVIKAQVPAGKRGKAGGIKLADTPEQARGHAAAILGMNIGGHMVNNLLVEEQGRIEQEYYAAVMNDAVSKGPIVIFSAAGGMDIEEIAQTQPGQLRRQAVDILAGFDPACAARLVDGLDVRADPARIAMVLEQLYQAWTDNDAELLEINPLALLDDGSVVALDCKFVLDDSAIPRQQALAELGTPDKLSTLESDAAALDLKMVELDGDIGVIANGAGLTMTTMDVISHYGGSPANFLEIGGEAYTKATQALKLLLAKPGLKSLVVNFCGAFARTDVMTDGIIIAWEELEPDLPVFFSIHGTGASDAREMLRTRLGIQAYADMDQAIRAAIAVVPAGEGK